MRRGALGTALAVVASVAVAACGSSSSGGSGHNVTKSNYGTIVAGTLPAVGTPTTGGTLTIGQLQGQTPTYISPLNPGADCGTPDFQLFTSLYIPLYYGPLGARPEIDESQSLAQTPVFSNGDKTVTINLKSGLKWSNGDPVTAQDVIFYLDLLKAAVKASPANWCQYVPGQFPDNVSSWTTEGADTLVLNLKSSVNPTWFTLNQLQDTNGGVYALPSKAWNVDSSAGAHLDYTNPANALKIYNYINKQASTLSTFATNPLWKVVDGPFKLKDFNATNSSYDLVPNSSYGLGDKPKLSDVSFQTYTSATSMLDAMESGSLDIGGVDVSTQSGSIPTLKRDGFSVYGTPGWGWYGGFINFKDKTSDFDKVAAQSYVRGVFAELVNQPTIIQGVYHGWAVPAYGPVATAPSSKYVPTSATANPYPFSPTKAVATLKAHGWDVKPGGQTTCASPGTASNECGAGIPKGTPIKFVWANLPESVNSAGALESEEFASDAKKYAGIDVTLVSKTFNFLTANYSNTTGPKYSNDWGVNNYGGVFYDFYPTQDGILSPGAGFNFGTYSDPTATKLMSASIKSPSLSAIVDEVKYLSKSYPIFWLPDPDQVYAVSNKVGGPSNAFLFMGSQQVPAQQLYMTKK